MKTVVFGLFDELDNARQMLSQLARSPLDLDSVTVVRADPAQQRALAREAALPARRGMWTALIAGGVVGGVLGAVVGGVGWPALGPLLGASAGVLAGGAVGVWLGLTGDVVDLPPAYAEAVAAAIAAGATLITVRTRSQPTARAIREAFVRAGSRGVAPVEPGRPGLAGASGHRGGGPGPSHRSAPAAPSEASPATVRAMGEDANEIFAPPWRRTPSSVRVPPGASRALEGTEPAVVDVPPPSVSRAPEPAPEERPPDTDQGGDDR